MCETTINEGTRVEVTLIAPCGKEVLLAMPEGFNPISDEVDIGVAIGTLAKTLGYPRRGWALTINKTTTKQIQGNTTETKHEPRQIFSR